MKFFSTLLLAGFAAARATDPIMTVMTPESDSDFASFVERFGVEVADEEYSAREAIFRANVDRIHTHNADPEKTWTMGINQFTHLTEDEFESQLVRGYNKRVARQQDFADMSALQEAPLDTHVDESRLPRTVDFRKASPPVLTPVKNQGACGSCWAFSATESIESHLAVRYKKLLTLSPQQLVDCAPNPDHCGGTGGCEGSTCPLAFNYTTTAGVITEANYPYTASTDTCTAAKKKVAATIGGYVSLPTNNYTALMNAIQSQPISISVAASAWGPYTGGIFDSASCGTDINHAVQLVGYGQEGRTKYWIVRNSWGDSWGEGGFIRVKRFTSRTTPCADDKTPQDGNACEGQTDPVEVCGLCGILSDSSYPIGGKIVDPK